MISKRIFQSIPTVIAVLLLSACFKEGINSQGELVTLNGSLLKGTIRQADVRIVNTKGQTVWQGTSDDQGLFNAELSYETTQLYTLVATVTQASSMMCDASQCRVPFGDTIYQYGQWMPGSEVGRISFRTLWYAPNIRGSQSTVTATKQINSMSSLVVDVIEKDLNANTSNEQYQQVATSGSSIVTKALGLNQFNNTNLLSLHLPDITKDGQTNNDDLALLGIVNASQAANISNLDLFTNALLTVVADPDDQNALTTLGELQNQIMGEAQAIVENPDIAIENESVEADINQSVEEGIDEEGLGDSIDELETTEALQVTSVFASNTHWSPVTPNSAIQPRQNHFWWVGPAFEDAWLQINFNATIEPKHLSIGLAEHFQGMNLRIQGSDDTEQWQTFITHEQLQQANNTTDTRYIKHVKIPLASDSAFKHYRLVSSASEPLRMAYFCLQQSIPTQVTDEHCQDQFYGASVETSGALLEAENIQIENHQHGWVSPLASSNEQWLAIEHNLNFSPSSASIVVKHNTQNILAELQGSNDGTQWITLTEVQPQGYPDEYLDEDGFRHLTIAITGEQSYRFFRYLSPPSAYVQIKQLKFNQ